MGKINVEAEKNELILENEFGDKVIIPAKKRQWVQKQIEKGNHADLDNYISTLPIKSDFAEEGSVVPGDPTKKVKVYTGKPEYFVQGVAPRNGERKNEDGSVSTHLMSYTSADGVHYAYPTLFQDGDKWIQLDDKDDWAAFKEAQKRKELFKFDNEEDAKKFAEGSWKTENIKEYDIDSPEYRELYNSGAIANYDKNSDTYILSKPLDEVTITAEAPQWAKDKRKYESQYTKDWYIDNKMPKFSRSMGVSATNMHSNNVKEYDDFINNKIVEDIFKRKPTFETDYSKDRLKTLQGFSQKELELIKNSKYAYRIEPSIWSKFEQGLLSVGNTGSSVQFKNPSLSQEEAKKEDNPLNILQPLSIPTKMVQSAYKDNYSLKDALKGKKNNAGLVEDIVTDPLNLVGVGLVGKLSKADKVIDATKAGSKVLNEIDELIPLYRIQEKNAKTFAELAKEGKIPPAFNTPEILKRKANEEKYFGEWFTKDKKDLDWYKKDREFKDPEIIQLNVPKSRLKEFQNYDKTLSRAPDREFIVPKNLQKEFLNKTDDAVNNITNQLDEIPHEIILDNNFRDVDNLNLQRTSNKVKKEKIPYEDIELGNDLYLRKNPSRTTDPEKLLGKNRAIISVKNKNNTEYIDLKSWKDFDGSIYYYMSANMPSSKIKAGRAYLELEKYIPKGASLLENSSLSYDSLINILRQTKNPKFETFIKGRIPMNDMSVSNKLKSIGNKTSDSIDLGFYSKEIADNAVNELNALLRKYDLPEASVIKRTTTFQSQAHLPYEKKDIFEIELPNIGLKKLYSIIGLTSAGAAIQSQNQNKTEQ